MDEEKGRPHMALTDNGNEMVMPVSPMMNSNNGFGWGDGSFWIIILFLFAFMGNGWGNWNGNSGTTQVNNDVQRGFDHQSVMNGISGINTALASAEISRCNTQANILQTLNDMAMSFQNCCCENRAQAADLKYTIATEACADRQAVTDALRDVIASNTANTQTILDKMCQQEIDALKAQNANLQTQINLANLAQSQTDQTAKILADNAAQTAALERTLNPTPVPAYMVQNPNCCTPNYTGCGCNVM